MSWIRMGWLRRLAVVCAGVAALGMMIGWGLVVRKVQVIGAAEGMEGEIISASGIELGDHLFLIDWEVAKHGVGAIGSYALEESRATFTGCVTLRVRERSSAAMLHFGEGMAVVDEDMRVIELRQDAPDKDLLFISGVDVCFASLGEIVGCDEARIQACRAVIAAAKESGAAGFISEANVEDAENIELIASTGMLIRLGDGMNLTDKLSLAWAAVQDIERRGEGGGVLDVAGVAHADYRPAGLEISVETVSADL